MSGLIGAWQGMGVVIAEGDKLRRKAAVLVGNPDDTRERSAG